MLILTLCTTKAVYSYGIGYDYNDGYEEGFSDGKNEGYKEGLEEGYNQGYDKGQREGYNEGYNEVYDKYLEQDGEIEKLKQSEDEKSTAVLTLSLIIILYLFYKAFHKDRKEKEKPRKIKELLFNVASLVVLFSSMLCGLAYLINSHGKSIGLWYLLLWFWAFMHISSSSDDTIKKLERENEQLKEKIKLYESPQ